jgi:hypothetical protein
MNLRSRSVVSAGTVHAVQDRHGLVTRGGRSARYHAEGTDLSTPTRPNDREPLLLCCDALAAITRPGA